MPSLPSLEALTIIRGIRTDAARFLREARRRIGLLRRRRALRSSLIERYVRGELGGWKV